MKDSKQLTYICIGLFYVLLFSMEAWFLGRVPTWLTGVIEIVLIFIMNSHVNQYCPNNTFKYSVGFIVALLIAIFWNYSSSFGITMSNLFSVVIMYLLMKMSDPKKLIILGTITKWFSILLTISTIAWLLHWIIPFPNFGSVYRAGEYNFHNVNYLFFTELLSDPFRFKSVFLEPGHVSMIATYFIAANRFNFKNIYVLLLSLCIIPTFGLSGYVLFAIGYALYSIEEGKTYTIIRRILPITLIFGGSILYFEDYNGGDNLFNELIMARLETDEEKGIVGNDRIDPIMEAEFNKAVENGEIIGGINSDRIRELYKRGGTGSGAKVYTLQHGVIGSFFLLLGYFLLSRGSRYRRWAFFMFLIYAISFFQRVYFFWAAYYIPYICALALPPTNKNNMNK